MVRKLSSSLKLEEPACSRSPFTAATFVPTKEDDPLSLPFEGFKQASTVTDSFYVAAQEALASFRSPIHKDSPKTFIVTGSLLAFEPGLAAWLGMGLQKRAEAYLTQIFYNAYLKEGIRCVRGTDTEQR